MARNQPGLNIISLSDGVNADMEKEFFDDFAKRNQIMAKYLTSLETTTSRLSPILKQLQAHSSQPALVEIDVVWPAILGNDLVDLRPYLKDELDAFDPAVIKSFSLGQRVVAVPTFIDAGLLYYRRDLLEKYKFRQPPGTWDELERMSRVIQEGERRSGRNDFWGYVWQGGAYEALTCNALEWQTSNGAANFIEADRTIRVYNAKVINSIKRAASWIGTISPPGESAYREQDGLNLWQAGQAAFFRGWASGYAEVKAVPDWDKRVGVASLPAGAGGHRSALGGLGIGVPKYAANRELAIKAIRELTSDTVQRSRTRKAGGLPTRTALWKRPEVMLATPLQTSLAGQVLTALTSRPSAVTGDRYEKVSHAYATAIHAVLRHQITAEKAMENLETELVRLTGFTAVRE